MLHLFGALGEFEGDLLRERTAAGLEAVARGRCGGRQALMTPAELAGARILLAAGLAAAEVVAAVSVSRAALYRALQR